MKVEPAEETTQNPAPSTSQPFQSSDNFESALNTVRKDGSIVHPEVVFRYLVHLTRNIPEAIKEQAAVVHPNYAEQFPANEDQSNLETIPPVVDFIRERPKFQVLIIPVQDPVNNDWKIDFF